MPTLEETLSNIASEVSQISSDLSEIGNATTIKSGLVKISDNTTPDDNAVPTVAFLKDRNILGAGGEAGGGLPQAQLEQVSALPATEILNALAALPTNLSSLAGRIIAVNSAGDGYEIIVAPAGGGGGGDTLPVSIVVNRFTGNGIATQFTLSQSPANSNALDITVSGVSIDPAIYSVSGTTLTFTDPPPVTNTNAIVVRHLGTVAALPDGGVITVKIANKAITLTKMADGTPGKYLKYNSTTGVIEETDVVATVADNSIGTNKIINKNVTLGKMADGTPGKFLKYNSITGVIEEANGTSAGNGNWTVIEEQVVTSNVTQMAFTTGINSTYREYRIRGYGVERAGGSGSNIHLQVTKNGGASYQSNSEYHYIRDEMMSMGGQTFPTGSNAATLIDLGHHEDGATGIMEIFFYEPSSSILEKVFKYSLVSARTSNTIWNDGAGMYGRLDFAAINGLRIFFANADSFSAGRFVLEGKN